MQKANVIIVLTAEHTLFSVGMRVSVTKVENNNHLEFVKYIKDIARPIARATSGKQVEGTSTKVETTMCPISDSLGWDIN